jgi:hypothetical protein
MRYLVRVIYPPTGGRAILEGRCFFNIFARVIMHLDIARKKYNLLIFHDLHTGNHAPPMPIRGPT